MIGAWRRLGSARWLAKLSGRRTAPLAALLAAAISLPTLGYGLLLDDHLHRLALRPQASLPTHYRGLPDFFAFLKGDRELTQRYLELGFLPWWSDLEAKMAFFRPLAAATHWVDYALWPDTPALMHLHSVLWYAALAALAALLYRRHLGASAALIAAAMFAVNHLQGLTVGWIANRNSLVSASLALVAVLLHHLHVERNQRRFALGGAALLGLALCAGETALSVAVFLIAHAVVIDRRPLRARLASAAPYAAVVLGWGLLIRGLGYGVRNTALYVDPLSEPLRLLTEGASRGAVLWAASLTGVPPDFYLLVAHRPAVVGIAVALLVPLLWAAWRAVGPRREGRFFLLALALSILALCMALPASRVLLVPSLAVMGLFGVVIDAALSQPPAAGRRLALGALSSLVAARLVVSPILFPLMPAQFRTLERISRRVTEGVLRVEPRRGRTIVLANSPGALLASYVLPQLANDGDELPRAIVTLGLGTDPLDALRVDERVLEVSAPGGFYLDEIDASARSLSEPMRVGQVVRLDRVEVRVSAVNPEGRPTQARFQFASSLDASELAWLEWDGRSFAPGRPPAVGERRRLGPFPLRAD